MAYSNFVNGFRVTTASAIDQRIILTKAEMVKVSNRKQYLVPNLYFALCADDGKFYLYDSKSAMTATTGRYHPIEEYLDFSGSTATAATKDKFEKAVSASSTVSGLSTTTKELNTRVTGVEQNIEHITIDGGLIS